MARFLKKKCDSNQGDVKVHILVCDKDFEKDCIVKQKSRLVLKKNSVPSICESACENPLDTFTIPVDCDIPCYTNQESQYDSSSSNCILVVTNLILLYFQKKFCIIIYNF